MATIFVRQAGQDYESQKLQEAFRLHEVPLNGHAAADLPHMRARIGVRTNRFKRDFMAIDVSPIAFVPAALVLLFVSVSLLVF
jgi:hypothetical protein